MFNDTDAGVEKAKASTQYEKCPKDFKTCLRRIFLMS